MELTLRSRTDEGVIESVEEWPAERTALVLCDVWDRHWCRSAVRRLDAMVGRMDDVVAACRERGVRIVHAPSDTMDFYAGTPARQRAIDAPHVDFPEGMAERRAALDTAAGPLPIDDSDNGCDDEPMCAVHWVWTRQHPAIRIDDSVDAVTDSGRELWNLLHAEGRDRVLIFGVHTNMCVLHRSFAIKALASLGVSVALVRDLTDTMYNPRRAPFVTHDEGTQRVIAYIERHWCPSVESASLAP